MVLPSPGLEPVGAGLVHPGVEDGLVGVHGQGHTHAGQLARQCQALLPGGDLTGGGHHAGHAHGGGALDQLGGTQRRLGAGAAGVRRDRQVRVVVGDRGRQGGDGVGRRPGAVAFLRAHGSQEPVTSSGTESA